MSVIARLLIDVNRNSFNLQAIRHATKKAGGSTKNGRDSPGQRLGVKKFGGEHVKPGNIIIRQRGTKYHNGDNTKLGRDHTIYAVQEGFVKFTYNFKRKHQVVSVTAEHPKVPLRRDYDEIKARIEAHQQLQSQLQLEKQQRIQRKQQLSQQQQ